MVDTETKKLLPYDMKRIISRAEKEFDKIKKGTEEEYDPQLNYIEHAIYVTIFKILTKKTSFFKKDNKTPYPKLICG